MTGKSKAYGIPPAPKSTENDALNEECNHTGQPSRDDLSEVVRFYLESHEWAEPLGTDGRCHFCRAVRVDTGRGPVTAHTDCKWWRVSSPMFNEEVARR